MLLRIVTTFTGDAKGGPHDHERYQVGSIFEFGVFDRTDRDGPAQRTSEFGVG